MGTSCRDHNRVKVEYVSYLLTQASPPAGPPNQFLTPSSPRSFYQVEAKTLKFPTGYSYQSSNSIAKPEEAPTIVIMGRDNPSNCRGPSRILGVPPARQPDTSTLHPVFFTNKLQKGSAREQSSNNMNPVAHGYSYERVTQARRTSKL
jgi:hypothetical protein